MNLAEQNSELFFCSDPASWKLGSIHRQMRFVDNAVYLSILQSIIQENLAHIQARVVVEGDAFLILTPREFDSEHYELNMWRVSALYAKNENQLKSLLSQLKQIFLCENIDFVSIDIEASDLLLTHLLCSVGFYEVTRKITNIFYKEQYEEVDIAKTYFQVRPVKEKDWTFIRELAMSSALAPTLEKDSNFRKIARNCDRTVYLKWFDKLASGEWSDGAYVATRHEEIKGFVAFRFDRYLQRHLNKNVTDSSSIAFATRDGVGAYVNVLDTVPQYATEIDGFISETTIDNKLVLKYCKKRNFQTIAEKSIFHLVKSSLN